jgi:hypothetical protein
MNDAYSLDLPLQRDDMVVNRYYGNTLHALLSFGLVILIRPKIPAAWRIKQCFHTLQENRKKTSQLMGFIHDYDNKGTIKTCFYSFVNLM